MLKIHKKFDGKTVTAAAAGDTNQFLQSVLVEVATENYRQLMYESIVLGEDSLDPPLRANERVLSGLFSNAIGKTAARSRPEARIDRSEIEETTDALMKNDPDSASSSTRAGRVDFLAWYGQRTYGIELKMAAMNCETPKVTTQVQKRWETVVAQAVDVQNCLRTRQREDKMRYPNPVSLALMVVIGRRVVSDEAMLDDITEMESKFLKQLESMKPRPLFMAMYTFPMEFRRLARRSRGQTSRDGSTIYTPFVAFIARPAVSSAKGASIR
jgi:hypothetical protein